MNDLFPDEFLATIARLRIDLGRAAASPNPGAHMSRAPGLSLDFRDYRAYTPGDDLRRVDWNVYQRTGHLFVRRFEHPSATPIYVLLDDSASMFAESPSRHAAAARVTAALASASLRGNDPFTLFTASGATAIHKWVGPRRMPEVLRQLAARSTPSQDSLTDGIRAVSDAGVSAGVLFILSDFFDSSGIDAVINRVSGLRHRTVLIQITQPGDAEPSFDGDIELIDAESNASSTLSISPALIQSYKAAYRMFQDRLTTFANERAAGLQRVDAAAEILPQLGRLFHNGVLAVMREGSR